MKTAVIEVTNSMSPQGSYIGNASEMAFELISSTDDNKSPIPPCGSDCLLSTVHGRGVGLSLSPTSSLPLEDFSLEGIEIPSLVLDAAKDDTIVEDYTAKMDLTEQVIKSLSETGRNVLDVLSVYDVDKHGFLSIPLLKKCLTQHSLSLTDFEFQMVFEGFMENGVVNYIRFLKSWSDFMVEPEWSYSYKRSSSGEDDSSDYSMPKRRPVSITSSLEDESILREKISTLIIRHFGNYQGIFKELAVNDILYISDFHEYLIRHDVSCSLNQLSLLLKPYCCISAQMKLNEFRLFISEISSTQTSVKLVEAFPNTFGYTTRIRMKSSNDNSVKSVGTSKLHRTPSVAQNLNNLPLYRLMLNMNDESFSCSEDDAVFV